VPLELPVWRNRNFVLLWIAQAVSQTAMNAIWYGIVVVVEERTHSSTQLSLAVLTLIIPSVIFGVLAGVYVDRWDKRLVLIAANVIRGGVAFAYMLYAMLDQLPILLLFLVNFIFATIGQFFAPAEQSMIPGVVSKRRLLQANGLFHLTFTASQLLGLVVMGPLLAKAIGAQYLFFWCALAIVVCGALVWPLPRLVGSTGAAVAETGGAALRGVWRDVRDVGTFVLQRQVVALAMVQWTIGAILGLVIVTLMPGFGQRLLHVSAEDTVFVLAPAGVGMVLGTAAVNRWADRIDKHFLANTGLFLVAACQALVGLSAMVADYLTGSNVPLITLPWLGEVSVLVPFVMLITLLGGTGFVAIMVPTQTYLQEQAPEELRGRVFAVQLMLGNFASILPLLLLGGLADLLGVDVTLLLIGAAIATAGLISLRIAPGTPPWRTAPAASGES
jgi:MFS family permease